MRRKVAGKDSRVGVVAVDCSLSRLLYLAFPANLGLLMHTASRHRSHSLTSLPKDGGVSYFGCSSGRSSIQFLTVLIQAYLQLGGWNWLGRICRNKLSNTGTKRTRWKTSTKHCSYLPLQLMLWP